MRSRAAGCASISVTVKALGSLYSLDFVVIVANELFAADSQFCCVFRCVHFMMQTGIPGLVVVDVIQFHFIRLSPLSGVV